MSWVHQDPVTKSQRITKSAGAVTRTINLDPWGGETSRSSNQAFQPHRYTSYERDGNGGDEAMMRRYTGKWHRFAQPDPYDGSYDLTNPQSFNRYAYVQNDPVNFVDPSGLLPQICGLFNMGDGRSGFVCFGDPAPFGGWEPKPGGPPDNPSPPEPQDPRKIKKVTECEMFANIVAELASQLKNGADFVQALRDKFTQDKDRLTRGSEGFKTQFKDDVGPGNSPNQVRHYVGALYAGFLLGIAGNLAMNFREVNVGGDSFPSKGWPSVPKPTVSPSGRADMALNAVAAPHGVGLMSGRLKPADLADKIRQEVCE